MEGQDSRIRDLITTTSATVTLNRDIDGFQGRSPEFPQHPQPQVRPVPPLKVSRIIRMPGLQEFIQFFECPVCYDTVVPPINRCTNGHILCLNCRSKVRLCPVCRASFSDSLGFLRNMFAEQVSARCVVRCQYHEAGCNAMFGGKELMGHEYHCDFGPIRCPDCDKHIDYHEFIKHLQLEGVRVNVGHECHTRYEITGNAATEETHVWKPTWIQAYDTNFFAMLERNNSHWHFSVACFGTKTEAAQYLCGIALLNKDKEVHERTISSVFSLRDRDTHREAIRRGEPIPTEQHTIDTCNRHGGVDVIISVFHRSTYLARLIKSRDQRNSHLRTVSTPETPTTPAVASSASSSEERLPNAPDLDVIVEGETEIIEVETGLVNVNIQGNTPSVQSPRVTVNENGSGRSSRNVEHRSPVSHSSASTNFNSNTNTERHGFESEIELIERRSSFSVQENNNISAGRRPRRYSADSLE